jgi:hypothetical protein
LEDLRIRKMKVFCSVLLTVEERRKLKRKAYRENDVEQQAGESVRAGGGLEQEDRIAGEDKRVGNARRSDPLLDGFV